MKLVDFSDDSSFLKPLIWQNQKCSLKVGFNIKLLLTFWNLFWNYQCILLQESSAATTLILSERQHFEVLVEVNRNKQNMFKVLALGIWRSISTERWMVMFLSIMKTSIWCFGHIKRKVSLPTPAAILVKLHRTWKHHHHPHPHDENHSGSSPFLFQKSPRNKRVIKNLCCVTQFKLFVTGSSIQSIYLC